MGRLFDRLISLTTTGRRTFLDRHCADDPELRAVLEGMEHADRGDGPLDRPLCDPERDAPTLDRAAYEPPTRIGPYRLLRPLDAGGMGRVYLAVQHGRGFVRRVAIKLPLVERSDTSLDAFLAQEIELLARLEHPGIARLYDGGTTDDGRPYLVMEHVEGKSIDHHCDRGRLTIDQRLHLVRAVCDAVAHVHSLGWIHCDLKPSNILVDRAGRPRVLDFGIAHAGERERENSADAKRRPHTPTFASPEQRNGAALTPASDVYALGVLLHLLLVGRLPDPRHGGRPSLALVPGDPDSLSCATDRRARTVASLRRRLHGDLDAIVAHALANRPACRYTDASQLARDLDRHVAARPVHARPPSWRYRSACFARRHRWGLATTAVLVLAGLAITSGAWRHAHRLDHLRAGAARVTTHLTHMLEQGSAPGPRAHDAALGLALERAALEVGAQPALEALVLYNVGQGYREAGFARRAEPLLLGALRLRQRVLGDRDHRDLAASLLGAGAVASARGNLRYAEDQIDQAVAMRRRLLGEDHPGVAEALEARALLRLRQWRLEDARRTIGRAIDLRLAHCPQPSRLTALDLDLAATIAQARGDLEGAARASGRAANLRDAALAPDHTDRAYDFDALGDQAFAQGAFETAVSHYRRALALRRQALGEPHLTVSHSLQLVARALGEQGRYGEARTTFEAALAQIRTLAPGADADFATLLNNLAVVTGNAGDHDTALALFERALATRQRLLGPHHPHVGQSWYSRAWLWHDMGDLDAAEAGYRHAMSILDRALPAEHPAHAYPILAQARLALDRGHAAEAERLAGRALARLEVGHPPGHWRQAHARSVLGGALLAQGRPTDAAPLLHTGHAVLAAQRGHDAPRTRRAAARLRAHAEIQLARGDSASKDR